MNKLLEKINTEDLLKEASALYDAGFKTTNMGARYRYFQEARSLTKIAKEIFKYETMKQKGDY